MVESAETNSPTNNCTEILAKIEEELETLEQIYDGEEIIESKAQITSVPKHMLEKKREESKPPEVSVAAQILQEQIEAQKEEAKQQSVKGKKNQNQSRWVKKVKPGQQAAKTYQPKAPVPPPLDMTPVNVIKTTLKFKPQVGEDESKIAVHLTLSLLFKEKYPKEAPSFQVTYSKGLDDDQIVEIKKDIQKCLEEHCNDELEEDEQVIYTLYMALQEIVSNYNDNLRGRCAVCLEKFCETEEEATEAKFSERPEFVRIDGCFHRFHLLCVYRDWFMQRHVEVDEFGNNIRTELPEVKKCPVCRNDVTQADIETVKSKFESNDVYLDIQSY